MGYIVNNIENLILLSSIIPLGLFVFRYAAYSPFERTAEGINILLTKIAIMAIVIVVLASLFFHNYPGRDYFELVAYTAIVALFWTDLVQLWRIQRKYPYNRRKKK